MTIKQLNPLNCPETFTILSLIAFVGLLITIISVTILLFRQSGITAETMVIALDEIKDSVVKFINSKKGGETMGVFGEMAIPCNSVVGHDYGLVIVKQDDGALFFCEMPEQIVGVGEAMNPADLISISNLPEEKQEVLKKKYEFTEV